MASSPASQPPSQSSSSRSRVVKICEEDHTLGTTLVSSLWALKNVVVAQYAQEHAAERGELSIHCQTDGEVTATASLQEAVLLTKSMLTCLGDEMDGALKEWNELPENARVAMNARGVHELEAQMAAAEEDLRQSRLDDQHGDMDNPFRRIVRDADRRRRPR